METLSNAVKVNLANYFANLPIPNTFGGIFKMSVKDWLSLLPAAGFAAYVGYISYLQFCPKCCGGICKKASSEGGQQAPADSMQNKQQLVNLKVDKGNPKLVHTFDMEDLGNQVVLCRCWRSKKFPYCDGTHNQHNKDTGDNVGPVVLKKKN